MVGAKMVGILECHAMGPWRPAGLRTISHLVLNRLLAHTSYHPHNALSPLTFGNIKSTFGDILPTFGDVLPIWAKINF